LDQANGGSAARKILFQAEIGVDPDATEAHTSGLSDYVPQEQVG
jgi:hypothetical protein